MWVETGISNSRVNSLTLTSLRIHLSSVSWLLSKLFFYWANSINSSKLDKLSSLLPSQRVSKLKKLDQNVSHFLLFSMCLAFNIYSFSVLFSNTKFSPLIISNICSLITSNPQWEWPTTSITSTSYCLLVMYYY